MPGLDAGHGLVKGGDWVWFYREAAILAGQIQTEGWQAWNLRPSGNAPIGIAAAVFAVTGIFEPWILLPINATLFAVGGICLFRLFCYLAPERQALFAVLPYVLFPSAALTYGQIHKDVYSLAGILVIFLVWAGFAHQDSKEGYLLSKRIGLTILGCFLVWIVRPYLLGPLLVASLAAAFLLCFLTAKGRGLDWWFGLVLCIAVQGMFFTLSSNPVAETPPTPAAEAPAIPATTRPATGHFQQALAVLNTNRIGFANSNREAGSAIDTEVVFDSWESVIFYIPRALQIGVLAPFPSMWFSDGVSPGSGAMRFFSGLEMTVSYVLLVGIAPLLWSKREQWRVLLVFLLLPIVLLLAQAFVVCNIGTLYRMRYGTWHVLVGMGMIGWSYILKSWYEHNEKRQSTRR
jgi:hypothetical protein